MNTRSLKPLVQAAPFWCSVLLLPLLAIAVVQGGWSVLLVPAGAWFFASLLDAVLGESEPGEPGVQTANLSKAYSAVLYVWPVLQAFTLFGLIYYVSRSEHLGTIEIVGIFFGAGIVTGMIGIPYSHELMHRNAKLDLLLADILLAMVLYSHFRSEHLNVHHVHVGTRNDPVTARLGEGFPQFFLRVVPQCLISAWQSETRKLARKGLPWWHKFNPFWRYVALNALALGFAFLLAGTMGLGLLVFQALVAIWQLEVTNYVEHYGLTRKVLPNGEIEAVALHHSWNENHRFTNWLLLNLQRHSEHHMHPSRHYPELRTRDSSEAPQLPFSYPIITLVAVVPPLWRQIMNPRVVDWRARFYPEIEDWSRYDTAHYS